MSQLPGFDPTPACPQLAQPLLMVVVDTEEEFDWGQPFNRDNTATRSIPAPDRAHAIYDRLGVVPTYVMDYPVATAPQAAGYLRRLVDAGRAEFGTHCHPWVTPPHSEAVSVRHSYHGNLPPELEAAKIQATTDAIAQAFGRAPRIFKAGRYGLGTETFNTLNALGYGVDCSFVPQTTFAGDGGPSYFGTPVEPFFVNGAGSLLEVPLTVGHSGLLAGVGNSHDGLLDNPRLRALRVPGICSRLGLLERARLSPEGFDAATQCRLLKALVQQGRRVFTMTYHSPSLAPGHTPYVRDEAGLAAFLACIEAVLTYFQRELGGAFTSMARFEQLARGSRPLG